MNTLFELLPLFGRLHMVMLHLPIGLIVGLFVLEALIRWRKLEGLKPAVRILVVLTALTTVAAAGLGYLLTFETGFDHNAVFWHKWLGILLAVFAMIGCLAYLKAEEVSEEKPAAAKRYNAGYGVSLVAMVALLPVVGHLGGDLVHGPGYLTEGYAEALGLVEPAPPAPAGVDPKLEYALVIKPILERSCISCHREGKAKGDLQLDTPEGMIEYRGEDLPVIFPGDALGSELVYRITLPPGHGDSMPPGHHSIPAEDVLAIIHWINRGADFGEPAESPNVEPTAEPAAL